MVSLSRLGRQVIGLHRRRRRRDRASVIRSQPRLSGRHGIATSVQAGKRCIGSPVFAALPARNWYCTSGESSSGRVLDEQPDRRRAHHQRAAARQRRTGAPAWAAAQPAVGDLVHRVGAVDAAIDDAAADVVLQILADARQIVHDRDAVAACSSAPGPMPESCSSCGELIEPPREQHLAPRSAPCARRRPARIRRRPRACLRTARGAPARGSRRAGWAAASPGRR